jgi:Uma2 family endonuclease
MAARQSLIDVEPEEQEPVIVKTGVTADEYFAMPETMMPFNLIEGVLYSLPSPFMRHQQIVGTLFITFAGYASNHGGEVILSPMDCKFSDGTVMQPDVAYIAPDGTATYEDHVMGAPDLVIEVLSRGTRRFDRDRKLTAYGKYGVREAWLVDPRAETVTVFEGDGSRWVRETSVAFGEAIPSRIVDIGDAGLRHVGA